MDERRYYLDKAAELHAKASEEKNSMQRTEFQSLARSYWRLAEQAEKNSHADIGSALAPQDDELSNTARK